ncbi:pisatin demethylase [Cladophialophora carrionii]|uniref:Pisatin demethylase n=1 Tax=Cladophialophora carrionii TaxID=86049 RepID=A0A1C1CWE6_9EURO|nr:pisatin demethylase [Cladophialophora carrionii]
MFVLAYPGIILALGLAYLAIDTIYSWYRLRHVPGPFSAGFSKWWLFKHTWNGTLYLESAEQCFKHGSLVRIGPNDLITNDPDILKRMGAPRSPYRRSDWYNALRVDRENILSERDEERHAMLRNKMAAGYAGKENPTLEQGIDDCIAKLVDLIERKYISTAEEFKPLDFARKAQYLTLDIIAAVAFGGAFGFLEKDEDVFKYIQTTESTIPAMILCAAFPWLSTLFQSPLMKFLMPKDTDVYGLGRIMGAAREVVQERFQPDAKPRMDMLGSFLRHNLSREDAETEVMVQILAGSDTTAGSIRATMLHLLTNPPVLAKLLAEIQSADISDPIQDSEARKLPYLQAVIKEGLRIHPPVTGLQSKVVPPGGDTLNGYYVPAGTRIGSSAWGVFLDPGLWGPDARVFRPERFLEGTPDEIKRKEIDIEGIFGYGRSSCLGKSVAAIELNKVFVQLLRKFEFTIVNPQQPWKSFSAGVFIVSDMWLRVTKREQPL